ncbi:MAG TPA: hypothetical protein VLJ21_00920 [Candidatus Binatia bacterium]|nr:hypothetical protein [Candidatus Binatia bacterium]
MAEKKEDKLANLKPAEYFEEVAKQAKSSAWDSVEFAKDQIKSYKGQYPKPVNRFRVILEGPNASIEGVYFWCLTHFRMIGFPVVDKISDIFTASEASSLFGAGQQRLGLTQDRVMQFLRVIHDMVRSLSVYVRELRAIGERLSYYEKAKQKGSESDSAEKTLKGYFVDLVEGGSKSPASVFGLAQQVGFVILPHLFFETRQFPGESDGDFWKRVDSLEKDFPKDTITVLRRKLTQYHTWKKATEVELTRRRSFLLRYFRQYYSTIKLYMNWVKPYLKVINRLGMNLERNTQAEIVRAFETSLVEIEILGRKAEKDGFESCILMTFQYRTKPSMSITTPDFQHRGPVHVGEAEVTWRSYGWNELDVKKFKQLREQEDFELLTGIDETLKSALEGVDEDLRKYLEESEKEAFPKEEKKEEKPPVRMFEPIISMARGTKETAQAIGGGFEDVFRIFFPAGAKTEDARDGASKGAKKWCFIHYKNFKKSHGLAAW